MRPIDPRLSGTVKPSSTSGDRPQWWRASALVLFGLVFTFSSLPSTHASPGSIAGVVFEDADRSASFEVSEPPFTGFVLDLFDEAGTHMGSDVTDPAGRYSFASVPSGRYTIQFSTTMWWQLRNNWVPTTTGSLSPNVSLDLSGDVTRDLGLRRIVRSNDIDSPISTFVAPSGLHVASYNDAVTAREIHDALLNGSLVGPEAATTRIYFDYQDATSCVTTVAGSPGSYTGWAASIWIDYLPWLDAGDSVLFHEYGHDWSLYNAHIVQQDPTLASYLTARGVAGDQRLGTSKYWDPSEMIAEDYRILFGSSTARRITHANTEIAAPGDVPGLVEFLRDAFTRAPSSEPAPSPTPSPSPTPEPSPIGTPDLAISDLLVTPRTVKDKAIIAFAISVPASISVRIEDTAGNIVRALSSSAFSFGEISLIWNRKNDIGRRVRSGEYRVVVTAEAPGSGTIASAVAFTVA